MLTHWPLYKLWIRSDISSGTDKPSGFDYAPDQSDLWSGEESGTIWCFSTWNRVLVRAELSIITDNVRA